MMEMQREPFDPESIGMGEVDTKTNELSKLVIGAAIEVHRTLGPGYLESVYEKAMCVELSSRGIPFKVQHPLRVFYKGSEIGEGRVDILVDGCLILELKAVDELAPIHSAQVISYLKAMQLRLGLLINFNSIRVKDGIKRIIL